MLFVNMVCLTVVSATDKPESDWWEAVHEKTGKKGEARGGDIYEGWLESFGENDILNVTNKSEMDR
jgi:hypothetical protein